MTNFERNFDDKKWFQLSLSEQMANIGSEVARAIRWHNSGEEEHKEKALERALELFDLTLSDKRWKNRAKEIARMREVICDFFYGGNEYLSSLSSIDNYFLHFALAARLHT
ncbi:MAG: hypothetical protein HYV51_01760 [Parcubacteria group bacterium]|nr:hypothetical protein [Parcubacteria group bacterium]